MNADQPKPRTTSRLTLIVLVVTVFSVLIGLLLPAILAPHEGSGRAQCRHNLMQIGMALNNYWVDYRAFPPAYVVDRHGRPMHSWRALLLPYLDGELARQYDFDEPWDGPHNQLLFYKMPDALRCPDDKDATPGTTNYVAVIGNQTAWPYDKNRTLEEFSDGLAKTAIIVEVTGLNIPWTAPRDLDFDLLDFNVASATNYGVKSHHHGGASLLMADGSVRFLPPHRPPELLQSFLTIAGGEDVPLP